MVVGAARESQTDDGGRVAPVRDGRPRPGDPCASTVVGEDGIRWWMGSGCEHAIRPRTAAHGAVVRALRRRRGAETERGVFSAVVCSDGFGKVAAREQKAVEGSEEEIEVALIGIVADGDNPGSC